MKREEVLAVLTRLIQCAARDYEKWDRLSGNQLVAMLRQDRAARDFIASALDDAERYRWLRYSGSDLTPLFSEGSCGPTEMFDGDELDTAIDTARAAAAGGEGVL